MWPNALLKSCIIDPTNLCSSNVFLHSFTKTSWRVCPGLKPNCIGCKMLFSCRYLYTCWWTSFSKTLRTTGQVRLTLACSCLYFQHHHLCAPEWHALIFILLIGISPLLRLALSRDEPGFSQLRTWLRGKQRERGHSKLIFHHRVLHYQSQTNKPPTLLHVI